MSIIFQADGIPTNVSAAFWEGEELPDMTEVSVCAYLKLLRGRAYFIPFVSYAIPNNTNEMLIG